MTVLGVPFVLGWGYSIGDVYSLEPKWSEHAADQGRIPVSEEGLQQNFIVPYGFPFTIDVGLNDVGADIDDSSDDVPITTGYVRTETYIRKSWGWSISHEFEVAQVLVDDVWTGVLQLTLSVDVQNRMGLHAPHFYRVRVVLNDGTSDYAVYTMLGTLVVRS